MDKALDRYGQLNKTLIDKLQKYETEYFREDKPVPFKGLYIYPITVRDFEMFSLCSTCLTLNKNESREGIRMSNLGYLISKMQDKENPEESSHWSFKLQRLFELIFHIQNGLKCKKCGHIMKYDDQYFQNFIQTVQTYVNNTQEQGQQVDPPVLQCPECTGTDFIEMIKVFKDPETGEEQLIVDGHIINKQDFNELRQIVLFQNFYDYADDSWVDPEVKRDHDEKMRLEQQKQDIHASIEKKVVCLSVTTNYKFQEIYDMSIRKFTLALATVDDLINYKIMRQAVSSGFVSLPKGQKIDHWIYKPNKDMYGDSYKSTEEINNSVSNL